MPTAVSFDEGGGAAFDCPNTITRANANSMRHVFLLGNPRSGTSLLRLMVAQHPVVIAPPECGFAHWWLPRYGKWAFADNTEKKINTFLDDLFTSKKIDTWNLDRTQLFNHVITSQPKTYSQLVDCVFVCYRRKSANSRTIILDKNNYYIYHLEDLPSIWPDANYLYIVRDGRDVACSYLEVNALQTDSPYKPTLPTTLESIAVEWNENNQNILSFLAGQGQARYFTIKYEDLILDTRKVLRNACSFFNIDYSEDMLCYYRQNSENSKEPKETLDWKRKTLEKPDATRISRYKTELRQDQIELFNRLAYETLRRFSYA